MHCGSYMQSILTKVKLINKSLYLQYNDFNVKLSKTHISEVKHSMYVLCNVVKLVIYKSHVKNESFSNLQ